MINKRNHIIIGKTHRTRLKEKKFELLKMYKNIDSNTILENKDLTIINSMNTNAIEYTFQEYIDLYNILYISICHYNICSFSKKVSLTLLINSL